MTQTANSPTRQIAEAAQTALFTDFDSDRAQTLIDPDYIQHNPAVPTGRETILGFLPALKASGLKATTHRTLADGDLVAFHNTYENADLFGGPSLAGFDIYRVANGQVVEHWDNLAPLAPPNPSGRTQTDGPTAVTDLALTEANRAVVKGFIEAVLIGQDFPAITDFISQTDYAQHNTGIADGLDGLNTALAAMAREGLSMTYARLHRLVAEGNFVLAVSEGQFAGAHSAFYDLFRLEAGRIVEHWDIISEIPAEMAHDNGKF